MHWVGRLQELIKCRSRSSRLGDTLPRQKPLLLSMRRERCTRAVGVGPTTGRPRRNHRSSGLRFPREVVPHPRWGVGVVKVRIVAARMLVQVRVAAPAARVPRARAAVPRGGGSSIVRQLAVARITAGGIRVGGKRFARAVRVYFRTVYVATVPALVTVYVARRSCARLLSVLTHLQAWDKAALVADGQLGLAAHIVASAVLLRAIL